MNRFAKKHLKAYQDHIEREKYHQSIYVKSAVGRPEHDWHQNAAMHHFDAANANKKAYDAYMTPGSSTILKSARANKASNFAKVATKKALEKTGK